MMRAVLDIPARLTPKVADSLKTLYSIKAESVHHAIVRDTPDGEPNPVRAHRAVLLELDNLLQQLDFDAVRVRAASISGARPLIAAAVFDALRAAAETISIGCDDYHLGRAETADLGANAEDFRGLLGLLDRVEVEPSVRSCGLEL
jgi:hypothetical protein